MKLIPEPVTKKQLENSQKFLKVLTPLRIIPLAGWYIADAQRGISAAVSGVSANVAIHTVLDALDSITECAERALSPTDTKQER